MKDFTLSIPRETLHKEKQWRNFAKHFAPGASCYEEFESPCPWTRDCGTPTSSRSASGVGGDVSCAILDRGGIRRPKSPTFLTAPQPPGSPVNFNRILAEADALVATSNVQHIEESNRRRLALARRNREHASLLEARRVANRARLIDISRQAQRQLQSLPTVTTYVDTKLQQRHQRKLHQREELRKLLSTNAERARRLRSKSADGQTLDQYSPRSLHASSPRERSESPKRDDLQKRVAASGLRIPPLDASRDCTWKLHNPHKPRRPRVPRTSRKQQVQEEGRGSIASDQTFDLEGLPERGAWQKEIAKVSTEVTDPAESTVPVKTELRRHQARLLKKLSSKVHFYRSQLESSFGRILDETERPFTETTHGRIADPLTGTGGSTISQTIHSRSKHRTPPQICQ